MPKEKPKLPPSLELYFNQLDAAIQKLMEANAQLKRLDEHGTYDVFETNADLEQLELVFSSASLDLAETVAANKFIQGELETDYMLIKRNGQEPISLMLSSHTLRLRNEDQS